MKQTFLFVAFFVCIHLVNAQTEITRDGNGSKVVKGFLTKQELTADTAFLWFTQNQKTYTPDQSLLQILKAHKDSVNIVAFAGTWCSDTKQILPQFFALADAASFPEERITLLGVDRNKKTLHHLSEAFNIINVPTFIVMKNGKEVGRVVEYGKTGLPLKELGEVIASSQKK